MKKLFLNIILSLFLYSTSYAQNPGTWISPSTTTTNDAVGIGVTNPIGWQEIKYCDGNQNGLVVTKDYCLSMPLLDYAVSFDGKLEPVIENGGTGVTIPYPTMDFSLRPYNTFFNSNPMIWARAENHNSLWGSTSGNYSSRFIVTPEGLAGVNVEAPRATFDVKSLGGYNYPGLVVGRQSFGTTDKTRHTMFIPLLHNDGYNRISEQYDQGMFFTDGNGANGENASSSFIIAPWADPNDPNVGGLKIDNMGNLEVHGKTRTTELNVNVKWWSDFVFENDYELMGLNELEKYINKNKHLPDVPSECELIDNGVNVAEMQAIQIQKIEELTLYTIAQEKKIESLEKELETYKNQGEIINQLQLELKKLNEKFEQLEQQD